MATPFFDHLGHFLRGNGAQTLRVNFCVGDQLYWSGPSVAFRGLPQDLPSFYAELFDKHHFTDVILFGDTRILHAPIFPIAKERAVAVHVFEEGYLRPFWITLERGGVNARSNLSRNPRWYIEAARALGPVAKPVEERAKPLARAFQDMAFHAVNTLMPRAYPSYQTHRPRHPAREYAGWSLRLPQIPFLRMLEERQQHEILSKSNPVFFFPLQLSGDSQITKHSPFENMAQAIAQVIESFAHHAPADAQLIIKNHPLDTGLDRHRKSVAGLAQKFDLGKRVHYFETGHLPTIVEQVKGTIVVNSTVGLSALGHGCPVKTLADPIYNLRGLTFRGNLDEFWSNATPPKKLLYKVFRDVLLKTTQVNGNFFTRSGIRLAVRGCDRMLAEESPLEALRRQVAGHRSSRRPAHA